MIPKSEYEGVSPRPAFRADIFERDRTFLVGVQRVRPVGSQLWRQQPRNSMHRLLLREALRILSVGHCMNDCVAQKISHVVLHFSGLSQY